LRSQKYFFYEQRRTFYITGIIPEANFCDREKETLWMVRTLKNKAHVLLTSPRRMGKTQLIRHVFEQPTIKNNYYTFYVLKYLCKKKIKECKENEK